MVSDVDLLIENGIEEARFLFLEAEPINEPVFQYGPFVMSTKEEIIKAYQDYQENQFGGWPWHRYDPVNQINDQRFAQYMNGIIEYPIK